VQVFRTLAAAVTVGALAAACGAQPAPRAPASTGRSTAAVTAGPTAATVAAGPTAAGNRKLARQEAQRLLSKVPVPAGAALLSSVPRFVPAGSVPDVTSLVDQVRAWRLPLPEAQAAMWLRTHPPSGLPLTLTGSGTGTGGIPDTEYGYAGPRSPAWQSAELDVEVVAAPGGTSVMRADGMVIWLDPVPLRDTSSSPRIRVTVARGCPGSDAPYAGVPRHRIYEYGVANHGADLGRRLLPAATPTAGLECRYYGLNGPAFRLRSATRLDAAQARRLAAAMTALPLSHPDGGVAFCPFDDESAEVVALSYPHRADVDLWVKLNGCTFVSNGYIRTAGN
jgi:hypothetical protein